MSGYWEKILRVDLTEGRIGIDPFPEDRRKAYIGGTGVAAKILYDEMAASVDRGTCGPGMDPEIHILRQTTKPRPSIS